MCVRIYAFSLHKTMSLKRLLFTLNFHWIYCWLFELFKVMLQQGTGVVGKCTTFRCQIFSCCCVPNFFSKSVTSWPSYSKNNGVRGRSRCRLVESDSSAIRRIAAKLVVLLLLLLLLGGSICRHLSMHQRILLHGHLLLLPLHRRNLSLLLDVVCVDTLHGATGARLAPDRHRLLAVARKLTASGARHGSTARHLTESAPNTFSRLTN